MTTVTAADGHLYRVLISWPDGEPPKPGWPVLYLLDGADHFATVTETARRFARAGARSKVEPGIVVGLDSGTLARRVFDYTPPSPGYIIPSGAPASGLTTGGSEQFLDFVDQRVKPLVAARWRIDASRQTMVGHSFGGLLTLHAFLTRPNMAARYAAISPSLWFGGSLLAREERGALIGGGTLLLAMGDVEGGPAERGPVEAAALAQRLATRGADTRFVPLAGHGHGSTMLAAMGEVVTFAFGAAP